MVFWVIDHNRFLALFDSYTGAYGTGATDVIQTAASLGHTMPTSDIQSIFVGAALLFTSYFWTITNTYVAGEVKNVKRNMFWGVVGGAFLWYVLTAIIIVPAYYIIGPELISAADYLFFFHPEAWKIPTTSFFTLYSNIATGSLPLAILINIAFIYGYGVTAATCLIYSSRAIFALSFDRLLPEAAADVSERFHTSLNTHTQNYHGPLPYS